MYVVSVIIVLLDGNFKRVRSFICFLNIVFVRLVVVVVWFRVILEGREVWFVLFEFYCVEFIK